MASIDIGQTERAETAWWTPTMRQGVLAVVATTALDAATTVVGLQLANNLVETNPIARAAFGHWGILPGVVAVSAVVVAFVVAATESGVALIEPRATSRRRAAALVRAVGYGAPSLFSLAVASHNVTLLVGQSGLT